MKGVQGTRKALTNKRPVEPFLQKLEVLTVNTKICKGRTPVLCIAMIIGPHFAYWQYKYDQGLSDKLPYG